MLDADAGACRQALIHIRQSICTTMFVEHCGAEYDTAVPTGWGSCAVEVGRGEDESNVQGTGPAERNGTMVVVVISWQFLLFRDNKKVGWRTFEGETVKHLGGRGLVV